MRKADYYIYLINLERELSMKHAYLIMAHNEPYILERLLKLIDDKRNDIYLHIDKKWHDFDFEYFKKIVN